MPLSLRNFLLPVFTLLLLTACGTSARQKELGRSILKYATLLTIEEADSFTLVIVKDAWKSGQVLATYVLVPRSQPLPSNLPKGELLRTPLQRAVITTSVHAALVQELGAEQQVAGLADTAYIISPTVKGMLQRGAKDMGSALSPDLEKLRAAHPDAILTSPFENAGNGALDALQIPLIQCADYMEISPLARAEWIRLYGRLFGRTAEADSIFQAVESAYLSLKERAAKCRGRKPTVMCDLLQGGTWYQPGGASVIGQLIADAGGDFLWKDRKERGSLALDLEQVYQRAAEADIWLIKYGQKQDLTYEGMQKDYPQYRTFRPWREQKIFACNTLKIPFYEREPFHPERLLCNFIAIFHPELNVRPSGTYYTPLHP